MHLATAAGLRHPEGQMDFSFTPEQQAWRNEIKRFLIDNLPPDYDGELAGTSKERFDYMMEFNRKLAAKGWLTMSWPEEYGGAGAGPVEQLIFHEEYGYHRGPNLGPGVRFVGPAIIAHGSPEQKAQHLPAIAGNTAWWCQGFSEPGSGSDLASLQTRAVLDGDRFVVSGSKIWTSWAHLSDWCWLPVRTNPDVPKHKGISVLAVDMKTPGISIRPVYNMAGYHHFNQVFFDDVVVPRSNMVGPLDRGWYVMTTTLEHERATRITNAAEARRTLEDLAAYAANTPGPDGAPLGSNRLLAQRIAQLSIDIAVARLLAYRTVTAQLHGEAPDKVSSMLKLWVSELLQRLAALATDVIGPLATLREGSPQAILDGRISDQQLIAYSATLASGTSEIQRNIIATRGLGMPR